MHELAVVPFLCSAAIYFPGVLPRVLQERQSLLRIETFTLKAPAN
jgi:hypothetical protein